MLVFLSLSLSFFSGGALSHPLKRTKKEKGGIFPFSPPPGLFVHLFSSTPFPRKVSKDDGDGDNSNFRGEIGRGERKKETPDDLCLPQRKKGDRRKNDPPNIYLVLKLTARHVQVACLLVEREEREVHGAGAGERDADAVQDVAVGEHAHVQVGLKIKKTFKLRMGMCEKCLNVSSPAVCRGICRSSRS